MIWPPVSSIWFTWQTCGQGPKKKEEKRKKEEKKKKNKKKKKKKKRGKRRRRRAPRNTGTPSDRKRQSVPISNRQVCARVCALGRAHRTARVGRPRAEKSVRNGSKLMSKLLYHDRVLARPDNHTVTMGTMANSTAVSTTTGVHGQRLDSDRQGKTVPGRTTFKST